MALERTYNIPLRKEWLKAPKYRRAKRAIAAVRTFLLKHMKASEVKIGQHLNISIWKRGIKSPPHHVEVNAVKNDKGVCFAELVSAPAAPTKEVKEAPKAKAEAPKAEKGAEIPAAQTAPEPAKPAPKKTEQAEKQAKAKPTAKAEK